MGKLRTASEEELAELLSFDREYAGSGTSPRVFQERFEGHRDLFVVYVEDGELVAEANGRMGRAEEDPTTSSEERVVLQSIAVKHDRRGEGLGRTVLEFFEEQATNYAGTVGAASTNNVEGFYQRCGYEPSMILLHVAEDDLPEGYEESDHLLGERNPDPGTRFLYAGFEEYDPERRRALAEIFNAYEANTIYRKEL